jgi:hypothetical protein
MRERRQEKRQEEGREVVTQGENWEGGADKEHKEHTHTEHAHRTHTEHRHKHPQNTA